MADGLSSVRNKEGLLAQKMLQLGIKDSDIVESFTRSSGPGGQNVNKTSTCVYLKHLPTGITVKCQKERSQVLNRYLARKILLEKLEKSALDRLSQNKKQIAKLRRQARKRSQITKLKILEAKRRQSEKKKLRTKIRQPDLE